MKVVPRFVSRREPHGITPEIKAAAEAFSGRRGGTATAAEALASRRGHCVSFTNLVIAMARSHGYRVRAGAMEPRADTAQHMRLLDDFERAALHVNNLAAR